MSNSNPYYRSCPDDDQFARDSSPPSSSVYQNNDRKKQNDLSYKKPYFSQAQYTPQAPRHQPNHAPSNSYTSSHHVAPPQPRGFLNKNKNNNQLISECKHCHQITGTFIQKKNSIVTWILCIILLVTTYVCFFLPFLFDSLKNQNYICRNCGKTKFVVKKWI